MYTNRTEKKQQIRQTTTITNIIEGKNSIHCVSKTFVVLLSKAIFINNSLFWSTRLFWIIFPFEIKQKYCFHLFFLFYLHFYAFFSSRLFLPFLQSLVCRHVMYIKMFCICTPLHTYTEGTVVMFKYYNQNRLNF